MDSQTKMSILGLFWVNLYYVGGCEGILGDWEWLWVVVKVFWVIGGGCEGILGDWGWLHYLVTPNVYTSGYKHKMKQQQRQLNVRMKDQPHE